MANPKVPCVQLSDGFSMPIVGLGTWQGSTKTDVDAITANVESAIRVGYRHIDTAEVYASEAGIGAAIKAAIKQGLVKREDLFVTTKLWSTHNRREDVVRYLRQSLDKLGLEYVDLFLIHWPCSLQPSDDVFFPTDANGQHIYADDIDYVDTWKGMEEAHGLGLTKHIGVSNFNKSQIQRILASCKIRPKNNQVEVSMFFQNQKLIDFCQAENISVTGFRNLDFLNRQPSDTPKKTDVIEAIAKRLGKTIQQVALRYQTQRGVAVIPKSSNEKRLKQNLEAVDFTLTDADMEALKGMDLNKRSLNMFSGSKHDPFKDSY